MKVLDFLLDTVPRTIAAALLLVRLSPATAASPRIGGMISSDSLGGGAGTAIASALTEGTATAGVGAARRR